MYNVLCILASVRSGRNLFHAAFCKNIIKCQIQINPEEIFMSKLFCYKLTFMYIQLNIQFML